MVVVIATAGVNASRDESRGDGQARESLLDQGRRIYLLYKYRGIAKGELTRSPCYHFIKTSISLYSHVRTAKYAGARA